MTLIFLLTTLFLFVLGASIGSFINVVLYRTIEGGQWIKGRSHCDYCKKPLAWYDLVPLLSYFLLGGYSRCCHRPLSISHPVIEFLTGSLLVWWYWFGFLFFRLTQAPFQVIQPLFWLTVAILLLIILLIDLKYMLIPGWAVISLAVLSLLYRLVLVWQQVMQFSDFQITLAATGVAALFIWSLWYVTKGKGMGYGDVQLAIPLGLLLGFPKILVGMLAAFILGAIWGLALIISKKGQLKQAVPFGPFLIIGAALALVWGERLAGWYVGLL